MISAKAKFIIRVNAIKYEKRIIIISRRNLKQAGVYLENCIADVWGTAETDERPAALCAVTRWGRKSPSASALRCGSGDWHCRSVDPVTVNNETPCLASA